MRVHVFDLGEMQMDRSLVVANWRLASLDEPSPVGALARFPVPGYFIDHPDGGILFDTGCHPDCMGDGGRWPRAFQRHYPYCGGPEHFVVNRLAAIGVRPDDVRTVVLSHLHNDHSGALEFFPRARVIVHEDELHACLTAYARGDRSGGYIWDDTDHWTKLGLDFDLVRRDEGDRDLVDGITILNLGAGHAAGMLGLLLRFPGRAPVIVASDAIYCAENLGPPLRPAGVIHDRIGYVRTVERLARLSARLGAEMWFGHDPEQFARLKHSPDCYE